MQNYQINQSVKSSIKSIKTLKQSDKYDQSFESDFIAKMATQIFTNIIKSKIMIMNPY
jgi:hypothetical protein